jgi:rhamnogalacturonyl hydrolase YesR
MASSGRSKVHPVARALLAGSLGAAACSTADSSGSGAAVDGGGSASSSSTSKSSDSSGSSSSSDSTASFVDAASNANSANDGSVPPDASQDDASVADAAALDASRTPDGRGPDDAAPDGSDIQPTDGLPTKASILSIVELAADYQVAAGPSDPTWTDKWTESTFYMGVMAAYRTTGNSKYLTDATNWAQKNNWTIGVATDPNYQSAGQVYTELYSLAPVEANAIDIASANASVEAMVALPPIGKVDWYWCDSLFMAPPLLARLGAATNSPSYFSLLDTMWLSASNYLWDPAENLYWRDDTFFNTNTFWSRGNGWVIAGIARVLEYLPTTDASRSQYLTKFTSLAAALAPLQGTDGLWRSNLLDPNEFPNPETSGTGLMTFGIAWGINNGLLSSATYLPVVAKGWAGLVSYVNAKGMLEYVQPTGSAPAAATATDTNDYGVGAFLLAGEQVYKLATE